MGNGNWKHFGKFKSLSAVPTSNQGTDVVWNKLVASGSSVAIQGGPGLNPDGSPADGPIVLAHSFARQWGDKTAYHVGANYAHQEGDTIVVSVGNSSVKRTGWANNLSYGYTFATTGGMSVATNLGVQITNSVAGRWNLFGGIDVGISGSLIGVKCMAGQEFKFGGISTIETENQKTELIDTVNTFGNKISNVLVEGEAIGAQFSTVAGKSISQITGKYDLMSVDSIELLTAASLNADAADMFLWGAVSMRIDSAAVQITSTVATMVDGGIIKIG
jgi:hypothetical protein